MAPSRAFASLPSILGLLREALEDDPAGWDLRMDEGAGLSLAQWALVSIAKSENQWHVGEASLSVAMMSPVRLPHFLSSQLS